MVGEAYAKCSRQLMQPPLHLPVCSMMLLEQWGWLPLQTQRRKKKKMRERERAGEAPQELPKSILLQPAAKRAQLQPSPAGSLTPSEAAFLNCACHKAPSPQTSTQPATAAGLAATRGPWGRPGPGPGPQSFGAPLWGPPGEVWGPAWQRAGRGGEATGSGEEQEGGRKARGQLGAAQTGAGPVEGGAAGRKGLRALSCPRPPP